MTDDKNIINNDKTNSQNTKRRRTPYKKNTTNKNVEKTNIKKETKITRKTTKKAVKNVTVKPAEKEIITPVVKSVNILDTNVSILIGMAIVSLMMLVAYLIIMQF